MTLACSLMRGISTAKNPQTRLKQFARDLSLGPISAIRSQPGALWHREGEICASYDSSGTLPPLAINAASDASGPSPRLRGRMKNSRQSSPPGLCPIGPQYGSKRNPEWGSIDFVQQPKFLWADSIAEN
jgi:hypothetical protein